jgi:hypothetical protein
MSSKVNNASIVCIRLIVLLFMMCLLVFSIGASSEARLINNTDSPLQSRITPTTPDPREQSDVQLVFSTPDFEWHQTGGAATPYHIWATGDYWAQNFAATGLSDTSHMSLTLFINDNTLSGETLNLDVLLNQNNVGSISIPPGMIESQTFEFDFTSVAGPDYRIHIEATNTISPGLGSVSIAIDGPSYAILGSAATTSSIEGHVTDDMGNPLESVLVIAIQSPTKAKTMTNADGYYQISDLGVGNWWLISLKRGYKLHIARVEVKAGETTIHDFSMVPKP